MSISTNVDNHVSLYLQAHFSHCGIQWILRVMHTSDVVTGLISSQMASCFYVQILLSSFNFNNFATLTSHANT